MMVLIINDLIINYYAIIIIFTKRTSCEHIVLSWHAIFVCKQQLTMSFKTSETVPTVVLTASVALIPICSVPVLWITLSITIMHVFNFLAESRLIAVFALLCWILLDPELSIMHTYKSCDMLGAAPGEVVPVIGHVQCSNYCWLYQN